jgi:predicted nucleic acid-binding protein
MREIRAFIDTNILLCLLSRDAAKADRAEEILHTGGMVSVQVLNELADVAHRKLVMPWEEICELLSLIRSLCSIEPLNMETHERGMLIAKRYKLSMHDAMIIAAGLLGRCDTLYSEGMQDGRLIENQLHICNPFKGTIHIRG